MEWLDQPLGPMRVRAWGLCLNMVTNAIALYGLSQVLANNGGAVTLALGASASLILIALIAVPSK